MVLLRVFDPELFHRRSIRLKGYDYSRPGIYFFTICTNHREPLFGAFSDRNVLLSPFGEIVKSAWFDLPNHNLNFTLDAFVVMPDHFHGIIIINRKSATGGQSMHCEDFDDAGVYAAGSEGNAGNDVGAGSEPAPTSICTNHPTVTICTNDSSYPIAPFGRTPVPKQQPLTEIIRQFKTFSARRINELRKTPGVSVWQRNYYESIIHGKSNLDKVRNYILANPLSITIHEDEKLRLR